MSECEDLVPKEKWTKTLPAKLPMTRKMSERHRSCQTLDLGIGKESATALCRVGSAGQLLKEEDWRNRSRTLVEVTRHFAPPSGESLVYHKPILEKSLRLELTAAATRHVRGGWAANSPRRDIVPSAAATKSLPTPQRDRTGKIV